MKSQSNKKVYKETIVKGLMAILGGQLTNVLTLKNTRKRKMKLFVRSLTRYRWWKFIGAMKIILFIKFKKRV